MALWYVDTAAGGANNGTSQANAWVNIRSAFESAGYAAGDIIYVRRNQTHTMTDAACNVGDSGTFGVPIRTIGDQDALDIWADAGDVRPIVDLGGFSNSINWGSQGYWEVWNLQFNNGEAYQVQSNGMVNSTFYNCVWSDTGNTPTRSFSAASTLGLSFVDCVFSATTGYAMFCNNSILSYTGCTIDDAASYGIYVRGIVDLENVVFGGTTQNDRDIHLASGKVLGRNVTLNGVTTDLSFDASAVGPIAIEDYNGTKGAWHKEYYHGVLDSFASAGTVAGARANGCITAVRAVAATVVSAYAPLLIHEYACEVTAGSKTVDVFIQPSGWAAVPVTQGAASDIWVEVAAWDVATGAYLYFDSRDEGAQDAQVNDTWENIRVTGVAADAAGNIIVRVYQIRGDGADIIYVDRIIEVS